MLRVFFSALLVPVLVAVAATVPVEARPKSVAGRTQNPITLGGRVFASDISASSPSDVWVVGFVREPGAERAAFSLHWNGSTWSVAKTPEPGSSSVLAGVTAVSTTDAWAVGWYETGRALFPLLIHWDGSRWTRVRAPRVLGLTLGAVSADGPNDAWATGGTDRWGGRYALTFHWDGAAWHRVPNPAPPHWSNLLSISAASPSDAWAVGNYLAGGFGGPQRTLTMHWNGSAWTRVPSPSPRSSPTLLGVSDTSSGTAFAAGDAGTLGDVPLVIEWNGSSWRRRPVPSGPRAPTANDVAATSASDAWVVGSVGATRTFISHWDGAAWQSVPFPNDPHTGLIAVSADAPADAWAVGWHKDSDLGSREVVVFHWNGSSWREMTP